MKQMQSDAVRPVTLSITGMTCGGCVKTVERILSRIPGATDVTADLASGSAAITGNVSAEELVAALQAAGYAAEVAPGTL